MKKISWLPEWAQKIADFGSGQPDLILPGDLMSGEGRVGSGESGKNGGPYLLHRCPVCKGAMRLHGLKDFGSDLAGRVDDPGCPLVEVWKCVGCGKRLDEVQLMVTGVAA